MHPSQFSRNYQHKIMMMKRAGCVNIVLGLQSVDRQIIKNIKRVPPDLGYLDDVVAMMKRVGIVVALQYIMGLPGDTRETIQMNIDHALRLKPHYADFSPLLYLPASEIYEKYIEKGKSPHPDFSEEEVKRFAEDANIALYSNPKVLSQLLPRAIIMNPKWIPTALKLRKDLTFTAD